MQIWNNPTIVNQSTPELYQLKWEQNIVLWYKYKAIQLNSALKVVTIDEL